MQPNFTGTQLACALDMKVLGERARSRSERLRCVIVESGAAPLVEPAPSSFDEVIVIAQVQDEQPLVFAQRFADRLTNLERTARHLESVIVLVGNRNDAEACAARRRIIAALSSHARAHGALAELTLVTERNSGSEHQAELFALAEAVTALPHAELVPVRVRFGHTAGASPRRVA